MDEPAWRHHGESITESVRVKASPEEVWSAIAEPEKLAHWYADRAEGRAVVGGTITQYFDHFGYVFALGVLEADAPRRLVMRAPVPGLDPQTLEFSVSSAGDGTTALTLRHSGFGEGAQWDDQVVGVRSAWRLALEVLRFYVENHLGKERVNIFLMAPARFRYEAVQARYTTATGLAEWLCNSATVGGPGERLALTLRDGPTVTGKMLAITEREALMSIDQIGGTLALKAFSATPNARVLAVDLRGWKMRMDVAEVFEKILGQALDRLARLVHEPESENPAG